MPYVVFEDWWYLRFLLPGLAPLLALTSVSLVELVRRMPRVIRAPMLIVSVALVGGLWVQTAATHDVFRLWALERRYIDAGRYVGQHLPASAVVLATQESGSLRYYSGRPTLAWDGFDPEWLDRGLDFLRERGYTPFLLLESFEEPRFRSRFEGRTAIGALDWPPMAQIGPSVRLYDPAARARYLAGEMIVTDRVASSAR